MKKISVLMMFVMVFSLFLMVPTEVMAAEEGEDVIYVDGSALTVSEESSVLVYPLTRGVYMLEGAGSITVPMAGWAGCMGSTTANFAVSNISVNVALQEYKNGSWVSVDGWVKKAYNTYFVSSYNTYDVDGGTYYRVQTSHTAYTDWTMAATNGIWIN